VGRRLAEDYDTPPGGANREPEAGFVRVCTWYNPAAVRGYGGIRCVLPFGACALAVVATGCGGGSRQDKGEPNANFPVAITAASFPAHQSLAQKTQMTIAVRNAGTQTIPNVAVTVTPAGEGTEAQAFAEVAAGCRSATVPCPLADRSRPVWVVDNGPVGGVTAYSNTWALGRLPAGRTTKFTWDVTAVEAGVHKVAYRVAAGLGGKAKAVLTGGGVAAGTFTVNVDAKPAQAIVTASGKVERVSGK
jgi:hypothetical protein